ncbi:MAG: winged helix-turn-helix domain-containing protein [Acidobacteria bacterium]|nr:winged helix-turn-helix domain-containing protein [Acidobacteriota bacterium]
MVQQLGYHPTTTVMQKTSSWRALWARISRLWGGDINNFRREFGIPIPKPGSPTFKEDTQKGREQQLRKLRDQKKERFKNILELIEEHELISIRELLKNLDISKGMIGRHMKELRDTEQVDWLLDDDGKTYMYFLMEN